MLLSGALTWLLTTYASCAVAADVVAEDGCEANETYVSRLRSLDAALVSNACSSLLQEPGTRPITKTVTNTRTVVVATTTDLTVKTRTRRVVETSTTETTSFVTLTNTVTSYYYSTITQTSTFPNVPDRWAARREAPDKSWAALRIPVAAASQACSCYMQEKRARITTTVTTNIRQRVTATVQQTSTRTTFRTTTTTFTNLNVQGVYTYVTEHPSSTLTITVTICDRPNPTPRFGLQVIDTTPTRTDSYNLAYATPTFNTVLGGPDYRAFTLDFVSTPPKPVFNIDCLGRLFAQNPTGGPPLYASTSYFQPGFELVYFLTQGAIEKRQYIYILCGIGPAGFLNCRTDQPDDGTPQLTMFQTCPLYDEYYDAPLVIANSQSTDAPECFGLRFKRI